MKEKIKGYINGIDIKKWKEDVETAFYGPQEGSMFRVVLSINETLKRFAERFTTWMQEEIDPHLQLSLILDEEGYCHISLCYVFQSLKPNRRFGNRHIECSFILYSKETTAYYSGSSEYQPIKRIFEQVSQKITESALKTGEEYKTLLYAAEEKGYTVFRSFPHEYDRKSSQLRVRADERIVEVTALLEGYIPNKEIIQKTFNELKDLNQ